MAVKYATLNRPSLLSYHCKGRRRQPARFHILPGQAVVSRCALALTTLYHKPLQTSGLKLLASSSSLASSVAPTWRDFQGAGDWENLLQPLHPILRREIIRYAELVLACYKAFDFNPSSKRHLNCKHGKSTMFRDIGMAAAGYEITRYIYATPGITIPTSKETSPSRWIGYVSVSNNDTTARLGRRDILVSFRGTVTSTEWIANMMSSLKPAKFDPINPRPNVMVESGFLSLYTSDDGTSLFGQGSCRQQLLSEISKLISRYKDEEELGITLAGHSMGSSIALLLGYDITELGLNISMTSRKLQVTVYSFGGPRVGNSSFKARCDELGLKVLRIANVNDPVTKLPGLLFNEGLRKLAGKIDLTWIRCSCYAHVGVELPLDFFELQNPVYVHDLDAYIGWLKCTRMKKAKKEDKDLFCKLMKFFISSGFYSWLLVN